MYICEGFTCCCVPHIVPWTQITM